MNNETWMKSLRGLLIAMTCALAGLPAFGAVELEEGVTYLKGAELYDPACAWEASLVGSITAKSKGDIALASAPATPAGVRLKVEIVRLTLERGPKKGTHEAIVRANIVRDGKLLATRDFQNDESFKTAKPACDALQALGSTLGKSIAEWAPRASRALMECGDECVGIHPDETIVIGAEVLIAGPDAINDSVRDECKWLSAMVALLVEEFNEYDEPIPRAKLEARPIDIEKYTGRRLVLRVKEIHALGGGGWTGPKWMSLSGELHDGKALVGTFESYANSSRSLTACGSVSSLSEESAELIANWLRSPTMGARLK